MSEIVKVELITKIKYKGEEHNLQELFNYLVEQLEQKDNIMKSLKEYLIKIKETSTQQERIMAKYVLEYIEELEEEKVNE